MSELPSDQLVRRWYRSALVFVGVACLIGATLALMDNNPALAAAGAVVGFAWVLVARLIVRD